MKRILLIGIALAALAGPARAQTPPPPSPSTTEWKDSDLQPMTGKGESYQSTTLVTVAYGFIWLMVCGFVASVWLRGRKVERELHDLKSAVERRGSAKG